MSAHRLEFEAIALPEADVESVPKVYRRERLHQQRYLASVPVPAGIKG
jgi:hypothetical protein